MSKNDNILVYGGEAVTDVPNVNMVTAMSSGTGGLAKIYSLTMG